MRYDQAERRYENIPEGRRYRGDHFSGFSGLPQIGSVIKNLPAVQETWVWSLGQEDPLEKGVATHFSNLAWSIPWTEEPGGVQSMGSQRVGHDWATFTHTPAELSSSDRKSIFFEGKENLVWKLQAGSLCLFPEGHHVGWSTDRWDGRESSKYRSKDRHRNLTHINGERENS